MSQTEDVTKTEKQYLVIPDDDMEFAERVTIISPAVPDFGQLAIEAASNAWDTGELIADNDCDVDIYVKVKTLRVNRKYTFVEKKDGGDK